MAEYTPTTDWVAAGWLMARRPDGVPVEVAHAEFTRWLAAHDAELTEKVRAEAVAAVEAERMADEPRNALYNFGIFDAARAIRTLSTTPTPEGARE